MPASLRPAPRDTCGLPPPASRPHPFPTDPAASAGPRAFAARARRVGLLLAGVWLLNVFDLGFTLDQAGSRFFVEMNPLAARLLHAPPAVLVLYKLALLGGGTAILLGLRRHAVAERGCWLLLAASFYVAARWFHYFREALPLAPDMFAEE